MKWLKRMAAALAVLIALAAAILLALGQREGANRLRASIDVARPPEAVWPFLYEEAKLKQWVTWLESAQPSAAPTPGAHWVWRMRDENNGGQIMTIESVVTAVEPARRLEVDLAVTGAFRGHGAYRLEPAPGGGTRLSTEQTYVFEHWFARLMTPVVAMAAESKVHSDLALLKAAVEK